MQLNRDGLKESEAQRHSPDAAGREYLGRCWPGLADIKDDKQKGPEKEGDAERLNHSEAKLKDK